MNVRQILSSKREQVITIRSGRHVREVVQRLSRHRIGALVVVDEEGSPVGIVSERDIVRRAAIDENVFSLLVADIMTKDMVTGIPQDDISSVAHTMTERRIRHLPIVDNDHLVGIISIGDVLKAERNEYRGEIDTLETQIMADDQ